MLSRELLAQIRHIEIKAGRLVSDALAGEYTSSFKVRVIDWNVTAKLQTPYIKVFREERELTILLAVDVSASQLWGTGGRKKQLAAAELAAIIAFIAKRSNDKVGLIVFSDHVEQFIPPKKGRAHVWNLIRGVLQHQTKGRGTNIDVACDSILQHLKRRSTVFFISDFWAKGYERDLANVSLRHDLICVKVEDPGERNLPRAGVVRMRDLETGTDRDVDTTAYAETYARERAERDAAWQRFCRGNRIDEFTISTGESIAGPLAQFFRGRRK
jgi:uncharacterized protein (DUF58 family)